MQQEITGKQIFILALAAGICVANIYYSQPILINIAKYFNVGEGVVGHLPFYSQIGYGLGLLLLTPLGDKMDRKKLIIFFQALLIITLLSVVLVKNFTILLALNFLIGFFSVATQIVMPFAAALAGSSKGKIVGTVFTGVLVGILGARILSGFIANVWSWQLVYIISVIMLLITSFLIEKYLPSNKGTYSGSYVSLIASSIGQLKRFALLRKSSAMFVLVFGAFCSFWTTLTFQLSGPAFHYNSNQIGLFGILGIGGALGAPYFGKLTDKKDPAKTQSFTILLVIVSIGLMWLFPTSLLSFIIGIILLDIGVQATQVINISQIYMLDENAHSRINTIYMTLAFIGGAIGTLAGVQAWKWHQWNGVIVQLILWSSLALLISIIFNNTKK